MYDGGAPYSIVWMLGLALLLSVWGCTQKRGTDSIENAVSVSTDSIEDELDVAYVGTPQRVLERMLEIAEVSEDDVVYDLGSGDGRIPITAAQQFGARGVGIELKPELIRQARRKAELAGVADRVEFRQKNLFEANLRDATVVTLYLRREENLRLRPRLFAQLDPGDRVVSHAFDMGRWTPDRTETVADDTIYAWTIPEQVPDSLLQIPDSTVRP